MLRFTFKDEPVAIKNAANADPQAIGEELSRIAAENGGRLEPELAVKAASSRKSALRQHFEWDDKLAAYAYRLDQARELIRIIRVVDTTKNDGPRRAFISVHDSDGTAYRTVSEVLSSRDLQLAVLKAAERDLRAWEQRYSDLIEVCDMVRSARLRLAQQIDKPEARPQ